MGAPGASARPSPAGPGRPSAAPATRDPTCSGLSGPPLRTRRPPATRPLSGAGVGAVPGRRRARVDVWADASVFKFPSSVLPPRPGPGLFRVLPCFQTAAASRVRPGRVPVFSSRTHSRPPGARFFAASRAAVARAPVGGTRRAGSVTRCMSLAFATVARRRHVRSRRRCVAKGGWLERLGPFPRPSDVQSHAGRTCEVGRVGAGTFHPL